MVGAIFSSIRLFGREAFSTKRGSIFQENEKILTLICYLYIFVQVSSNR